MEWAKQWIRTIPLFLRLPGPPILPVIGNVFNSGWTSEILEALSTAYDKYGPISRSWFYGYPAILLLEPKHIQLILSSSKQVDKEILYNALPGIIGNGLITSGDNKWKSHRKFTQAHFNTNILEKCIPTFLESSQTLVKGLKNGGNVKISSAAHKYAVDAIHEIILGIPVQDQTTIMESPFTIGQNTTMERFLNPWLMNDFLYKFTDTYKNEVLQEEARRKFVFEISNKAREKKSSKTMPKSFLEFMIQKSKSVNDFHKEDVLDEACTYLLAGQDTMAITIAFTLYYLAKHKDIQDKVMNELNGISPHSNEMTLSTVNKMKYLGQCIKESMRLCPAVPLIARKLSEDVKLDKYIVPAGCNVFISPYATHRLPHYYTNPEEFDPERFSATRQDGPGNFAYLPFSLGPRNCIGYRVALLGTKIGLSSLLRNYKIHLMAGREQLTLMYRVALKAKGGIWLTLEPRNTYNYAVTPTSY